MKIYILLFFATFFTFAESETKKINAHSIDIKFTSQTGDQNIGTISRESYVKCRKIPFEPNEYWGGNHSLENIDNDCKKTFITSAGKLSPMKIHDDIETYGELEVLEFIEEMQDDTNMILIDSRKTKWFNELSIPTAINIPFVYFTEKDKWHTERISTLKFLGVKISKSGYDFTNAKTLLMFCNAVWCRQSPQMIEELLKIGYPPKKMFWYRGGLQSWLNVGMTSTKSFQKKTYLNLF